MFEHQVSNLCQGCSILKKNLPSYSVMDYTYGSKCKILFVSDFLKPYQGDYVPFRPNEYSLIMSVCKRFGYTYDDVGFTASVKCPLESAQQMGAKDQKICRSHIHDTLKVFDPELIFACGKLATTMLYGKNMDESKGRGTPFKKEFNGKEYTIVPIFHPWQVISEPKNAYLFQLDLITSIRDIMENYTIDTGFTFEYLSTEEDLAKVWDEFSNTRDIVAVDIETEGLDFLRDKIHTTAMSLLDHTDMTTVKKSIVFAIDHFEAPKDEAIRKLKLQFIGDVLKSDGIKVLQNCKFDLKFLARERVATPKNIWDIKIMMHLFNEDLPKRLRDMRKYFFPHEVPNANS